MGRFLPHVPQCSCGTDCTCGNIHALPVESNLSVSSLLPEYAADVPRATHWLASDPHFHSLPEVAVGARVMVLQNLAPHKGLVNGAQGTVTRITFNHQRVATRIHIQLASTGANAVITRSRCKHLVLGRRLFHMKAFPLCLSYAMTGHKAQGSTITGPLILDIHHAFTCGLVYTMLTRATHRDNLSIIGCLTPAMLTAVPDFVTDG
jgi:ATP-dependent exoDNAse (exonuclease V) alpha subunit